MAPFSFINLVEARSVGPLRGGDSQADCIRKLGTPEGVGGTSRKQRKPSVFKYGDLQLLFERPEMALYAAVIDVAFSRWWRPRIELIWERISVFKCVRLWSLGFRKSHFIFHVWIRVREWLWDWSCVPVVLSWQWQWNLKNGNWVAAM